WISKRWGCVAWATMRFAKASPPRVKPTASMPAHRTLESTARFVVEEPVLNRRVRSVVYDVDSADISQGQALILGTNTATNNTTNPATVELPFTYTDKKSRSWNNSVSFTTGISATFTAGVPEVASTSITISSEITTVTEWGGTEETEKSVGANYHVTVDPGKTVQVDLQATLAKCDVKFSYEQVDLLTTGETVVTPKTDGLYKGMNYINIRYVAKYV
ncbi:hypothetical protein KI387_021119, partial [Taxus chinensis]